MKLGIMQPYFLPYIGYFQLIKAVDKYVIYDDVNYINRGWINRNNLLINGQAKLFTISLKEASQNKLINEIDICDDFKKFLKTVEMSYTKAPHYVAVIKLLHKIISYPDKQLGSFLKNSIVEISAYLGLNTKFVLSSELPKDNKLKGQEKILNLCELIQSDVYINSIGGQFLYDKELFKSKNVELYFLQPDVTPYKQFNNEFVGGLSILDVLMFNSIHQVNEMLNSYKLI